MTSSTALAPHRAHRTPRRISVKTTATDRRRQPSSAFTRKEFVRLVSVSTLSSKLVFTERIARASLVDESAATRAYAATSPSVVGIAEVLKTGEVRVRGSGFVWASDAEATTYVATNAHAIGSSDGNRMAIVFNAVENGREVRSRIVLGVESAYFVNRSKDVGFVKIPSAALPPGVKAPNAAKVGTSDALRVGQSVFALGFAEDGSSTLNSGVIGGLRRRIPSKSGANLSGLIQTDAEVNETTSGGPLCDSSGRVVAMSVTPYGSGKTGPSGVNFAIPIDAVRLVAEQL